MASPDRQQPNKILSARATSKTDLESWPYEDFEGDPYWQGGTNSKPYRWQIDCNVDAQVHGDPSTRESFRYNGVDVFVGDWVCDVTNGTSLKIIGILLKTSNRASLIIEDVDRYNTFQDEDGNGLFTVPGDIIVFSISDLRMPLLNPLPSTLSSFTFANEVNTRFQNNNPVYRYRVFQEAHGLEDNQSIWVDPLTGLYTPVDDDDSLKRMVGTVDRTGPGEDIFYYIPTTKVVEEIDPALPGSAGDIIYVDSFTGELTVNPTERTKAAYIQLTNATSDSTRSLNDTVNQGSVLSINNVDITFTGNTLQDVADDVNAQSSETDVTAEVFAGTNETQTDSGQLSYGLVACIGTGTVARINGVQITFDDTTNGEIEFGFVAANAEDMANSINAASIANLTATGISSTTLILSESTGGAITIENVVNDDSNIPFAGNNSCNGVPLITEAGGTDFIEFTNEFGSGIIFGNEVGTPVFDLGLQSVRNGELPKGLVVEQWTVSSEQTGGVTVYPDLDSLPAFGTVGEQAFIIDSDDGNGNKAGEWSMLLWDGGEWVKTSDEDSANTDARSIEVNIFHDSVTETLVGTLSNLRRVTQVVVEVVTIFDGSPTLNIGDTGDSTRLMSDDLIDLSIMDSYGATTNFIYSFGNDIDVLATFTNGGSTQGNAKVVVTYV